MKESTRFSKFLPPRQLSGCVFICCLLLLLCLEDCDAEEKDISEIPSLFGPGSFIAFTITCADYAFHDWVAAFRYLLLGPEADANGPSEDERNQKPQAWTTQRAVQELTILAYLLAALVSGSGPPHYKTFNITLKNSLGLVIAPCAIRGAVFPLTQNQIYRGHSRWGAWCTYIICLGSGILVEWKLLRSRSLPQSQELNYQPSDLYLLGLVIVAIICSSIKVLLGCFVLLNTKAIRSTFLLRSRDFVYQASELCLFDLVFAAVCGFIPIWYGFGQIKVTFRAPMPQTVYRLSDSDQAFPLALALVCVLINRRGGILRFVNAYSKTAGWSGAEHSRWTRSPYKFNWQTLPVVEGSMQRWTTRRWEAHVWNAGRLEEHTRG